MQTRTDPLGQSNPSGHQDLYEYDLAGRLKRWTDREGSVVRYRDEAGKLSFVGYKLSGTDTGCTSTFESTTEFDWDGWGRLTEIDDSAGGVITRIYDELDRLLSEAQDAGTVTYTYDDADRRATMIVTGEPTVDYTYLDNGLVSEIARGTNVVAFTYDGANRPDKITLPNGTIQSHLFDDASQLQKLTYKKDSATTSGVISYGYDLAGRRSGVFDTFARLGLPTATTQDATHNLNNELTPWNGGTFSYDANGNLTDDGSQTYEWNARNQLTATSSGSATFAYDGLGRRASKTISGTTTGFFYDGLTVVQEQDGQGSPTANEITGLGLDQTFWRKEVGSGGSTSFFTDALGSTVALTDGAGDVQSAYTYEPYGRQTETVTDANPFQFTGREWDGATSLQFNRARYFSPTFSRFISEDPIGLAGGTNVYGYVLSSPTNFTDPSGLFLKRVVTVLLDVAVIALILLAAPPAGVWAAAGWSARYLIMSDTSRALGFA